LRLLVRAVIVAMLAVAASPLGAQTYPAKPTRLITLTAAGGALDLVARLIAQNLAQQLGRQVLVDNRVGAGGNLGAAEVARAAPDGYTIGMVTVSTHGINPSLYGAQMPFDPLADFEFLAMAAEVMNVVVINPRVPATNMREFAAYAQANPGRLNFGSAGTGTSQHLAGEMFKMMARVEMTHVPYKGGAMAVGPLVSGEIQVMFCALNDVLGFVRSGDLRAIAVTSRERSPLLPDVIPVADQGFPDYDVQAWFGVAAPRRTPAPVVERLSREINAVVAKPEFRQRLLSIGMDPAPPLSPNQMRAFVAREIQTWATVVKASGAKVE
jgi:tripartite-type tricarboxylate transporter receptor subunit TctC